MAPTTDKAIVVVTARDEARDIAATLDALRIAFPGAPIIVGDDGSRDATAALARAQGARVVGGARRGKGAAASRAAAHALELGGPDTIYVFCDADLGTSARCLRALAEPIAAGEADVAIAVFETRQGGGLGFAIGFARWAVRYTTATRLRAPICGQRALSATALSAVVPFAAGFGMELAMTIDALRAGERVVEIPLPLTHRPRGRDLDGFVHRARQLRDFTAVFLRRAKVRR